MRIRMRLHKIIVLLGGKNPYNIRKILFQLLLFVRQSCLRQKKFETDRAKKVELSILAPLN